MTQTGESKALPVAPEGVDPVAWVIKDAAGNVRGRPLAYLTLREAEELANWLNVVPEQSHLPIRVVPLYEHPSPAPQAEPVAPTADTAPRITQEEWADGEREACARVLGAAKKLGWQNIEALVWSRFAPIAPQADAETPTLDDDSYYAEVHRVSELLTDFEPNTMHASISAHVADLIQRHATFARLDHARLLDIVRQRLAWEDGPALGTLDRGALRGLANALAAAQSGVSQDDERPRDDAREDTANG